MLVMCSRKEGLTKTEIQAVFFRVLGARYPPASRKQVAPSLPVDGTAASGNSWRRGKKTELANQRSVASGLGDFERPCQL